MWITNSGLFQRKFEPMFTNVYCGATAQDDAGTDYSAVSGNIKPSYQANESCAILQDNPIN